ncbi:hypothetical protein IG631_19590 [Alternaria alternata]|nr:hypothetical protein IG631_19590 [Alternaria alternata]
MRTQTRLQDDCPHSPSPVAARNPQTSTVPGSPTSYNCLRPPALRQSSTLHKVPEFAMQQGSSSSKTFITRSSSSRCCSGGSLEFVV